MYLRPAVSSIEGKKVAFFGRFKRWPAYLGRSPVEAALAAGAVAVAAIGDETDWVVIGDGSAAGRAAAKTKAEKLAAAGKITLFDEESFRAVFRLEARDKSFCFAGGFERSAGGASSEDEFLASMVTRAGGLVLPAVTAELDYLVLGPKKRKGRTEAERQARALAAAGRGPAIIGEEQLFDMTSGHEREGFSFPELVASLFARVDEGKLKRALKMLKAESFKLYSSLDEGGLMGVIRSQTGVGTVYAPWLTAEGRYGCSTPELEDCMGMNGEPCKHLLVLVIGLSRSGELLPVLALDWIGKAATRRPTPDRERAAAAFIRYRGAEAGEIDWRPTETIPEDYYAV